MKTKLLWNKAIKYLASSFGSGDDFSSPGNSIFSLLPENTILLG